MEEDAKSEGKVQDDSGKKGKPITVEIIAGCFAILAAMVPIVWTQCKSNDKVETSYIEIKRILFDEDYGDFDVRLFVNVSGRRYAYPVKRAWAKTSEIVDAKIQLDFEPDYWVDIELQIQHEGKFYSFLPIDNYAFIFPSKSYNYTNIASTRIMLRELNMYANIEFTIVR